MKNYKKYIGCLSLSVLTLIGCEALKFGEKFLDKPISNEQNIDSVFNKKVYAEQALAETYHSLPDYLPMQGCRQCYDRSRAGLWYSKSLHLH